MLYSILSESKHFPVITADDSMNSKSIMGGKAWGLLWMLAKGLPVPPALVIPTSGFALYDLHPELALSDLKASIPKVLEHFKDVMGYVPLLSVRSGAAVSMPGMMDTVLNVGLDAESWADHETRLGPATANDCFFRFLEMYPATVCGMEKEAIAKLHTSEDRLRYLYGKGFVYPSREDQLLNAVEAVWKSWDSDRAKFFRQQNGIPDDMGTAVTIQAMVFGNRDDKSATGVLFSRNPDTGADVITGEFLVNAQGEEVVAGTATPSPLSEMKSWSPELHKALCTYAKDLEAAAGDFQDIEFTVESGKLWILQTRAAKRTHQAELRYVLDTKKGQERQLALRRLLAAGVVDAASGPSIAPAWKKAPYVTGIPACTGVVKAKVLHSMPKYPGKELFILVRPETTPDDIQAMTAAAGVITMHGGSTSHAAVVARGMNRPCVVGCGKKVSDFKEGTLVTMCGATGRVWREDVPIVAPVDAYSAMVLNEVAQSCPGDWVLSKFPVKAKKLWLVVESLFSAWSSDAAAALEMCEEMVLDLRFSPMYQLLYGQTPEALAQMVQHWSQNLLKKSSAKKMRLTGSSDLCKAMEAAGLPVIQRVESIEQLILATGSDLMSMGELNTMQKKAVARLTELGLKVPKPITFGAGSGGVEVVPLSEMVES